MEVFAQGLAAFPSGKHGEEALTYLVFPGIHQRHIKSTNAFVCYLTPTLGCEKRGGAMDSNRERPLY